MSDTVTVVDGTGTDRGISIVQLMDQGGILIAVCSFCPPTDALLTTLEWYDPYKCSKCKAEFPLEDGCNGADTPAAVVPGYPEKNIRIWAAQWLGVELEDVTVYKCPK